MKQKERPLYAVLIDADNIPAKFAAPILQEITSFGEPALRRVYGDWSSGRLNNWSRVVRDLGLVAHQETANTVGKNASDIGLVIDAMDILHTGRFDGFVLVSSDSDFTALANRIREQGLDVIGIGESKSAESLRNVCNRFVMIENIVDEMLPEPREARDRTDDRAEPSEPHQHAPVKQPPINAVPLILRAMDKIAQDDEWYALGPLGQYLTAENPDFDARTYGKRKLSDLILVLKRFETKKVGSQFHVRRVD